MQAIQRKLGENHLPSLQAVQLSKLSVFILKRCNDTVLKQVERSSCEFDNL